MKIKSVASTVHNKTLHLMRSFTRLLAIGALWSAGFLLTLAGSAETVQAQEDYVFPLDASVVMPDPLRESTGKMIKGGGTVIMASCVEARERKDSPVTHVYGLLLQLRSLVENPTDGTFVVEFFIANFVDYPVASALPLLSKHCGTVTLDNRVYEDYLDLQELTSDIDGVYHVKMTLSEAGYFVLHSNDLTKLPTVDVETAIELAYTSIGNFNGQTVAYTTGNKPATLNLALPVCTAQVEWTLGSAAKKTLVLPTTMTTTAPGLGITFPAGQGAQLNLANAGLGTYTVTATCQAATSRQTKTNARTVTIQIVEEAVEEEM